MKVFRWLSTIVVLALLVAACVSLSSGGTPGAEQTPAANPSPLTCPFDIQVAIQGDSNCQTPHSLRVAYGVESLMQRGYTGKGQTIVDIVSYGDPSLQQNMDTFDNVRSQSPGHPSAPRMWSLDPAGASCGGQCSSYRVLEGLDAFGLRE